MPRPSSPAPPYRPYDYAQPYSSHPSHLRGETHRSTQPNYSRYEPRPPAETDTLLPRPVDSKPRKRPDLVLLLSTFAVLLTVSVILLGLYASVFPTTQCNDPVDSRVRDRIRREWEIERLQHEQERSKQQSERVAWKHDEVLREETRIKWRHEVEEHKREREQERKREEEERLRLGFAWDEVRSQEQCISHGAKGYSANLLNVPRYYDHLKACIGTPIVIHGVRYDKPNRCEVDGGNIVGHWVVNNEATCSTYWQFFEDKGCTHQGSGLRRIQGPLGGLHGEDDWQEMCSTTPAQFRGLRFNGPHSCDNWGKYGIWGIWLIDDSECRKG